MRQEPIDRVLFPVIRFTRRESAPGVVLVIAVIIALLWANFGSASYQKILATDFTIGFTGRSLTKSIHDWVNDGLMTIFFFSVGLDIKQEIMHGELSSIKKATLPIVAALGGMVLPALIFTLFNHGGEGSRGWGIPMSTDIAFAVGLISFVSKQVPASLKVFLTALAVVDDLGAVLVIAIFYTQDIIVIELGIALLFMAVMFLANYLGIRRHRFYFIVGILGLWYAVLQSGVHATLAGVLAAIAIPTRTRFSEDEFVQKLRALTDEFAQSQNDDSTFISNQQNDIIGKIDKVSELAQTPLQRFAYYLSPLVSYVIMPVFALANAGVVIEGNLLSIIAQPVCYGIIVALLVGKFIGIYSFSRATVALGAGQMPANSSWSQLAGIAIFGGIGFTMSLFITELAFQDETLIRDAKIGVLIASLLASVIAILYFKVFLRDTQGSTNDSD